MRRVIKSLCGTTQHIDFKSIIIKITWVNLSFFNHRTRVISNRWSYMTFFSGPSRWNKLYRIRTIQNCNRALSMTSDPKSMRRWIEEDEPLCVTILPRWQSPRGETLLSIGKLFGHRSEGIIKRYAHLMDEATTKAAETAAESITERLNGKTSLWKTIEKIRIYNALDCDCGILKAKEEQRANFTVNLSFLTQ